jgi:hypothetical protein
LFKPQVTTAILARSAEEREMANGAPWSPLDLPRCDFRCGHDLEHFPLFLVIPLATPSWARTISTSRFSWRNARGGVCPKRKRTWRLIDEEATVGQGRQYDPWIMESPGAGFSRSARYHWAVAIARQSALINSGVANGLNRLYNTQPP